MNEVEMEKKEKLPSKPQIFTVENKLNSTELKRKKDIGGSRLMLTKMIQKS